MITYRMATQPAPERPVTFYKIIAFSFLIVTVILLGVIIFITSKKATIEVFAKQDSESMDVIVGIDGTGRASDAIGGMVSSATFAWSQTYHPTGNKIVTGTAHGEVTIYNKTSANQPLVKVTRLITAEGLLFRLSESTVVPANGEVTVPVYADKPGADGDIGPSHFTIPGLPLAKQSVIYADSSKAMSGGVATLGIVSAEDIANAEVNYKEKIKEAYLAATPFNASGEERAVMVAENNVKVNHRSGEEVSEFTVSGTSTIITVSYATDDLDAAVEKELVNKVDTTVERLLSNGSNRQVNIVTYNSKTGTAQLSVRQEVGVTLDANVEKLAPQYFYGKKKDEIERYVLSLDHVARVNVSFSPSWTLSAPTVSDKIRIVVKSVQ